MGSEPADDAPDDNTEEPLGRDDRVSLWPLNFEEVVRALHKTPAARRRGQQEPPEDEERAEA